MVCENVIEELKQRYKLAADKHGEKDTLNVVFEEKAEGLYLLEKKREDGRNVIGSYMLLVNTVEKTLTRARVREKSANLMETYDLDTIMETKFDPHMKNMELVWGLTFMTPSISQTDKKDVYKNSRVQAYQFLEKFLEKNYQE